MIDEIVTSYSLRIAIWSVMTSKQLLSFKFDARIKYYIQQIIYQIGILLYIVPILSLFHFLTVLANVQQSILLQFLRIASVSKYQYSSSIIHV